MFTGIVQSQSIVENLQKGKQYTRLTISVVPHQILGLNKGASVAINGVCLTAVEFGLVSNSSKAYIVFDVIDETLRITNLSHIVEGDFINVERSLKFGDEVGGHMVSGHIHCQGKLILKKTTADNCAMKFSLPTEFSKYIMAKGFISVNGASLTIGEVSNNAFWLHLIPETLEVTNIGRLAESDKVNIELDQTTMTIVSTIERMQLLPSV